MKVKQILTLALLLLAATLLSGCAGSQEEDVAEPAEAVGQAPADGSAAMYSREELDRAMSDAGAAIDSAREHGADPAQQALMLEDARMAAEAEDIARAVELAMAAEHGARQLDNDAMLDKARDMLSKVRDSDKGGSDAVLERVTEVETAIQIGNGEMAYEMATNLYDDTVGVGASKTAREEEPAPEAPKVMASSEPVPMDDGVAGDGSDTYKVLRGDNLWQISAKPKIYNNPYQWPLIYKANKSQIKDPDLIYPGQKLDIDRNATRAEVDAAVAHARNRGKWTLGDVEQTDLAYLRNSDHSSMASR